VGGGEGIRPVASSSSVNIPKTFCSLSVHEYDVALEGGPEGWGLGRRCLLLPLLSASIRARLPSVSNSDRCWREGRGGGGAKGKLSRMRVGHPQWMVTDSTPEWMGNLLGVFPDVSHCSLLCNHHLVPTTSRPLFSPE